MAYRVVALLLLMGGMASGASLSVDSGAQLAFATLSDLSSFIRLVNQTIAFVQDEPTVDGDVLAIPDLRSGVGVALGDSFGDGLQAGLRAELVTWGTGTEGTWTEGGTEFPVSLSLKVGLLALQAQIALEVVPGIFSLGLAGGWGWGKLDYACSFELPTDWAIPFQPPPGAEVYHTSGPMGAACAHVSLPFLPQFSLGFELGVRLAGLGMLAADGAPLDLDGDGQGESLDLSGFWLGLSVKLSFQL